MNLIVTPRVTGKTRLTRMIVAPMFLLAWVITLAFSATAHAAPRWIEGPLVQGPLVNNCLTSQYGFGVSSFVAYYGDPEGRRPVAGDTYYIGVIFQNAANICLGYEGVTVKLQLPPNTAPESTPRTRYSALSMRAEAAARNRWCRSPTVRWPTIPTLRTRSSR